MQGIQNTNIEKGKQAEERACIFLMQHGLQLVTRNYRCKSGEIDLIMRENNDIIFVEVKFRKTLNFGHALENITYAKQCKLIKSAFYYLQMKNWLTTMNYRFDVIGLSPTQCDWIKNAFSTDKF